MVTNPDAPEQSPGNREKVIDAVYTARDTVADGIRVAIAGDKNARIRRGVLYAIVVASFVLVAPLPGVVAVLLLAWTDELVEA